MDRNLKKASLRRQGNEGRFTVCVHRFFKSFFKETCLLSVRRAGLAGSPLRPAGGKALKRVEQYPITAEKVQG